jgi:hypothetical protein
MSREAAVAAALLKLLVKVSGNPFPCLPVS